ncbi:hypothetical protein AMTRI_Chr03g50470 [Amborella trichopoda]|uniref:PRONE domain-containing protein n=1 Tax=Amborella trichopoda TaxID=13333 RepID=W1NH54_AMBTC|nr:rop guanine nucleotide exchange factor 14 [Amborella trichopoda]XP_011623986.1 rop guanine nucleotide exchange factor 14 [Amborella trichopoda]XP_020523861.1 rop guanine nucleotide exchange factor 14 [Amborella trichopoda]XP_020523866.1 rop guanine nucleotide exchange factor 14 [Amborella trichopoda]XP_020523870.1 rop guanine nucleotide exchange factor 14 [Amborella trichopoda]ERM94791.1 hypothetical protein AMTR_s00011p00264790 [Amborella trichopoda]|eukprot:XP_006878646.1 rop guanine nucleotide exchange factor 14 [Amborella trichopoda]
MSLKILDERHNKRTSPFLDTPARGIQRSAFMKRLACCHREKGISIDFDVHEGFMTYNGLESCIRSSYGFDDESGTSRGDGFCTDSLDEDDSSCSSSKDVFGSFSSHWLLGKQEEKWSDDWESCHGLGSLNISQKPTYMTKTIDVETMKERFAKLLLGEDMSGGCRGLNTASALSNGITNLAGSTFGELWKLEPLSEERKTKWVKEMDWLLSPASYMVELVPAKQSDANGRSLEIMTPRARSDIHMTLPALRKLDSLLIETLDAMVDTEFWYAEGGSRRENRSRSAKTSMKWWLPLPRVPLSGLSPEARKKLGFRRNCISQVFKAAKAINEQVLLEMPVPPAFLDTLPKAGRTSLGEVLYRAICTEPCRPEEVVNLREMETEDGALEAANRLQTAILMWKQRITSASSEGKVGVLNSWSLVRDSEAELDKKEVYLERAKAVMYHLKRKFQRMPQTFLDMTKVQHNKDIGHSILEAYSRVLEGLAFSILSRIEDILQEDDMVKSSLKPQTNQTHDNKPIESTVTEAGHQYHRGEESLVNHLNGDHSPESNEFSGEVCGGVSLVRSPLR